MTLRKISSFVFDKPINDMPETNKNQFHIRNFVLWIFSLCIEKKMRKVKKCLVIKMACFSEDFQPNEDAKHTLRQKVALDKFFLWLFYLLYFISLFRLCILYPYSFHKEFRIAYKNMSIQNK